MAFPPDGWWPETMEIVFEHKGKKLGWLFGPTSNDQTMSFEEMKGCKSLWNTLVGMRQAAWEIGESRPVKANGHAMGAEHGSKEG